MSSRVLVVEDNADLRALYEVALVAEGFHVDMAENGSDALNVLRSGGNRPGVILLDLMMPVMSGWEFLLELGKDDALRDIPVVVCSAVRDRIPTGVRFLRKPIDLDTLLQVASEYCAHG